MKLFTEIRHKGMPRGEHISDFKVNRIPVMVHKERGKYVTYVDGDRLDVYKSQKEAEKAASEFMKQYKRMR